MSRWAVILAGGSGTRFWPLSTPERPKQLLPLATSEPLLVDAIRRLGPLVPVERTLIITSAALADAVHAVVPALPRANIVGEPRAAGTGPALAWAAADIARRDADDPVMLCVHADWSIRNDDGFRETLSRAAAVAERHGALVTVGIVPERPDPGFGYIQPGEHVTGARRVARFAEKPDRATAERMVSEGYLWNSGIFVWRAQDFLAEIASHTPEMRSALKHASAGDMDTFYSTVTPVTVDEGVLERSRNVLVIPGEFGWDDVGTWAALRRVHERDAAGNAVRGDVHLVRARDCVVYAEDQTVVLYGVADLVVVARDGLTVVTTTDGAADLKSLIDALPAHVRDRR
ncbi:MAG TPA: sugar phosphate nucleotidyltransferase [Candidatus Tumulicola sp.]|nr:sugar phosphate nucleotidyltransferase [Candidatus Tumulicola sp.]HSC33066.1 sugar phosphate nucleotidyltransferase [Gemmatimonadaceae bacterium]